MSVDAEAVIDFWFDPEHQPRWFDSTPEFDAECRRRFADAIEAAGRSEYDHWQGSADGALALILLLDQLTRNVYRGQGQAFAHDAKALAIAKTAIDNGFDQAVPHDRRFFVYLPFEHSEDAAEQARSVALFEAYGNPLTLDYAIRHQVIIERFGRFPHRNESLGRPSTDEEIEFLEQPGSSF